MYQLQHALAGGVGLNEWILSLNSTWFLGFLPRHIGEVGFQLQIVKTPAVENVCCLRIVFNTLWYYYCIARKVNLGLVICLRTQITQNYLYIAQGGYQSAIYQHTFSTAGVLTTWSWRPPSPMCLGKKPKNHVELRERIHSFNLPPPASACCSWYIVHTGLESTWFCLIWKAHHGQE